MSGESEAAPGSPEATEAPEEQPEVQPMPPATVRYRVRSVHQGGLRHGMVDVVEVELPIDEQPPPGAVRVDQDEPAAEGAQ